MTEPRWVDRKALEILVAESLEIHGGLSGIRDEGLLESALARPRNQHANRVNDVHDLATSYASGLVRNHPFLDGNKRAGFLAAALFLDLIGYRLVADEATAALMVLRLAASEIDETVFAAWLRESTEPLDPEA